MHVLIANRPLRTKRFLTALACGLDIISISWLKNSIRSAKLLDMNQYRLSNGYSLALSHWICIKMASRPVFSRVKVYGKK